MLQYNHFENIKSEGNITWSKFLFLTKPETIDELGKKKGTHSGEASSYRTFVNIDNPKPKKFK